MNTNHNTGDRMHGAMISAALLGLGAEQHEHARIIGTYRAKVRGYKDDEAARFLRLHKRRSDIEQAYSRAPAWDDAIERNLRAMQFDLEAMSEDKADRIAPNLVLTLGKNYLLDNGLAGVAYTATEYMLLISSVSFTAIVAGDTAASHAGWLEAGGANAPTYSGARKTAAWSVAAAGAKSLSAGLVFTFTGGGTVKGCGLTTASAVDATSGVVYSAGLFTGGDQPVVATNTLTVTYTASL